jgi:transposase
LICGALIAIEKTLPNAVIVVDKFRVVRNVMWALDRVRRRIVEGDRELRKLLKDRDICFSKTTMPSMSMDRKGY